MVWGAISAKGVKKLVKIENGISGEVYLDIVKKNIFNDKSIQFNETDGYIF